MQISYGDSLLKSPKARNRNRWSLFMRRLLISHTWSFRGVCSTSCSAICKASFLVSIRSVPGDLWINCQLLSKQNISLICWHEAAERSSHVTATGSSNQNPGPNNSPPGCNLQLPVVRCLCSDNSSQAMFGLGLGLGWAWVWVLVQLGLGFGDGLAAKYFSN